MDFPFLAAILAWLGSAAAWVTGFIAARWGVKVALIGIMGAVFVSIWLALLGLLAVASHAVPSSGFPPTALAFMPSAGSVSAAVSLYLSTLIALRSLEYWRMWAGVAAVMGAS